MANSNGGIIGPDNLPTGSSDGEVETFNSSGTYTAPSSTSEVQYLVIAGGGGGSPSHDGGGAGGYRSSVPGESSGGGASAEALSPVTGGSSYPVVVGGGGPGGLSPQPGPPYNPDNNAGHVGSNSSFNGVTSLGGGASGTINWIPSGTRDGGSGGAFPRLPNPNTSKAGTTGQGYPGSYGAITPGPGTPTATGGPAFKVQINGAGGGAGAEGTPIVPELDPEGYIPTSRGNAGLAGGAGVTSSITGSPVTRAGGGGGGEYIFARMSSPTGAIKFPNPGVSMPNVGGAGGAGGGGKAGNPLSGPFSPSNPTGTASGTANTGGGGGGGANQTTANRPSPGFGYGSGGSGGSGVVIIKGPDVAGSASGVWDMNALYDNVKAGTWV